AAGAAALAALLLVLAVTPLRERVADKGKELARGEINALLTGRLDGWRAAAYMTAQAPLAGVGHGAYRTEYADAKLHLKEQGVEFYLDKRQVMFANAHNEYLEAAAEWGLPGALALAWALWVLWGALRRRWSAGAERASKAAGQGFERSDAVVAWAGVAALAVLAAAQFPFRIALVAYQAILFLAWVLPSSPPKESS
ncbi:MAG: O-antigen ligase family protein, partial [Acidobacteriota bacterium]|nr:O-antigen ligase family protein [Acidobacteriota bacterium]